MTMKVAILGRFWDTYMYVKKVELIKSLKDTGTNSNPNPKPLTRHRTVIDVTTR